MTLFDACELGLASISIYEDQCPGAVLALRAWAEERKHALVEHHVTASRGLTSYTAYRVQFGIHQILVFGAGVLPPAYRI